MGVFEVFVVVVVCFVVLGLNLDLAISMFVEAPPWLKMRYLARDMSPPFCHPPRTPDSTFHDFALITV